MSDHPIHDAATLILWRRTRDSFSVLMGQRGAKAAFMPGKFVFPGGRVDPADENAGESIPISTECNKRLAIADAPGIASSLVHAAIRELREETGLRMDMSHGAAQLLFFFRAITPPGRPRRFDARFFLASAEAILGDPDDFSQADDELSHLRWVQIEDARKLDLPFVTQVVLAELESYLRGSQTLQSVPFFDNRSDRPRFLSL